MRNKFDTNTSTIKLYKNSKNGTVQHLYCTHNFSPQKILENAHMHVGKRHPVA
jgi:hypothetical protein